MDQNFQINTWKSKFGKEYTARNTFQNEEEFNNFFIQRYGISRDKFYEENLKLISKNSKILEVGANIGNQLSSLYRIGFKNLYGIEIQRDAINYAHSIFPMVDIIYGLAQDIPLKNNFVDAVFTNNVLIHISPEDLPKVLSEMHRVTKKYIFGFEYFASKFTSINYRNNESLLWKGDYCNLFLKNFSDLKLVKKEFFIPQDEPNNKDQFFVLEKIN